MSNATPTDNDRAYWNRNAKHYDRSMKLLGRPMERMLQLTGEAVAECKQVLEIAAGTGLVTSTLARSGSEVIATDYASEMVARIEERVRAEGFTNVRCEQADLYNLRFEPQQFDAVVAANVLHLLPDLPAAIAALRRVLKPHGRLIVPTFCHDETSLSWLVSRVLAVSGFPGYRRFTAASLRSALAGCGLQITRTETLPGVIPIVYVEGRFSANRTTE